MEVATGSSVISVDGCVLSVATSDDRNSSTSGLEMLPPLTDHDSSVVSQKRNRGMMIVCFVLILPA